MKDKILTEVDSLKALIESIPDSARDAYDQTLPVGSTLLGMVEKIEKINHRNFLFPWLALGCMLVGFFLSWFPVFPFVKMDVGERSFSWTQSCIQILPLIIFSIPALVFSLKVKLPPEVWNLKKPLLDLLDELKKLGLKPEECTKEGFERVLSTLAYNHIILERAFDLARPPSSSVSRTDLMKIFGLPILESEEELRYEIQVASRFGYDFVWSLLLAEAQKEVRRLSLLRAE